MNPLITRNIRLRITTEYMFVQMVFINRVFQSINSIIGDSAFDFDIYVIAKIIKKVMAEYKQENDCCETHFSVMIVFRDNSHGG
jgi:hypothetical protein